MGSEVISSRRVEMGGEKEGLPSSSWSISTHLRGMGGEEIIAYLLRTRQDEVEEAGGLRKAKRGWFWQGMVDVCPFAS